MNDDFNTLPWHDAGLLEVLVDRRHAGERDEVRLRVRWLSGDEVTVLFRECYAMTAEMNFGVVGEEHILTAAMVEDEPGLTSIRERWAPLGVRLDELGCYRIETGPTASVLKIYATQFEIV